MSDQAPQTVRMTPSDGLAEWLTAQGCALVFTSTTSDRLFLLGLAPDGRFLLLQQAFVHASGLAVDGGALHLASARQIFRLENVLRPGERTPEGIDRLYAIRAAQVTGEIDVHEMGLDHLGRLVFVNTHFSCLAVPHPVHSFQPLWKPPFISELIREDRCHLNGVAFDGGVPRFVTALAATDSHEGWRERRRDGGVVVEVPSGRILTEGLSSPHSPRIHEGALWLLESGRGWLVRIDLETGAKEDIAFLPGFARGLRFHGGFALCTLSKPRADDVFKDLPIGETLAAQGGEARCGVYVVDLQTRRLVAALRLEGCEELFDLAVLEGVRCPALLRPQVREESLVVTYEPEFASL